MAVVPEGSLFWSWLTKKPAKFAEDNLAKGITYWNHVLWSDEPKINLLAQMVFSMCGHALVRSTKKILPTVKHGGGSIMVWGCMTTAGTEKLRFTEGNINSNMYCDILKQKMIPPPPLQKRFSIITTPNTRPRWQLPCWWSWRWWSGQVCLQAWTILSTSGASLTGRWRSTMCLTSSSSVMSLWRSGRVCQQCAGCVALVNSMPRRIKAVLDNNDALQNVDTLDTVLTCSLRVCSVLLPVIWTIMVICWVLFRRQ